MEHGTYHQQLERKRKAAMELFAQDLSNAEIARRLHVARQTVSGWHNRFKTGGTAALMVKKPGPAPNLSPQQLEQVRDAIDAILEGPAAHGFSTQLWTLERIAQLIFSLTGVQYHPGYVWHLLGRMGLTCQKPECQAKERDQEAVDHFVNTEWPAIKRGR